MRELIPGTVFAGHRIDSVVGRGGMGVVYRATDIDLERTVAMKVIAPELLEDPAVRERFLREAKAAARVEHPNVIPLYYAGESEGIAYLAMRFVDGDDVRSLVRRVGPLAPDRAARLLSQAGAALDAIHAGGFVHRDVKPANLLLGPDDHVYVTDFGLAKEVISRAGDTATGHWVGTLDYVAPEQIRGERVDARADVYALGGVLHYMLTGHVPYPREGDEAKLWAHISDAPPAPSSLVPGVPERFDRIVARAMAKSADERYPSAGDLGRAAEAAAAGESVDEPERIVARGPAAPEDSTRSAPLPAAVARPAVDVSSATRSKSRSERETRLLGNAGKPPRGRALAALIALGLVAAAVIGVLIGSRQDDKRPATATQTSTPSGTRGAAHTTPDVIDRPNGITVAGGSVWLTSFGQDRLGRVDAASGRRLGSVRVGASASDITTDGRDLWIALARADKVVRVRASDGQVVRGFGLPKPTALVATARSIWVATRTTVPGRPDVLVRVDRQTGARTQFPIPAGVAALAISSGKVWIGARTAETVSYLDTADGALHPISHGVGGRPVDLFVARGVVWVSTRKGIARIAIGAGHQTLTAALPAPVRPGQIAAVGDRAFLADTAASRVLPFDANTLRAAGNPIDVGVNPYAVTLAGHDLFVAGKGDGSLTRVGLSG